VVRDAHSRYYLTAIADRVADMAGVDQQGALHDIAIDYENVRTAWRWAVEQGHVGRLHQALDGLFYYHYFSGRELEGVAELARARARLADLSGDFGALAASADLLQARLRSREHELAHLLPAAIADDLEDQISYFRARGERFEEALAMNRLAGAAVQRRDVAAALRVYQEQLALFEACGDLLQQGFCLTNVAQLAILSGQIEMGLQAAQRALALQAQQGDRLGASVVHLTLGAYEVLWTGDFATAARHYAEARAVGEKMRVAGHLTTGVVMSHAYQGFLALIGGNLDAAQSHAAETARLASLKNTPYAVALSQGLTSLVAVTAGDSAQARARAMEALVLSTQPGAAELAQIGLALAACAAGDAAQALNIVRLQWTVSVSLLKLPSRSLLLFFLPVVIWLLAEHGRDERAVELMALGRAQAHCPHGWWDRLGLLVELERRLVAALPPGVYRAAQARGQQQGFAAEAEALLGELSAL
jgi:tetratricopeptide (TPR) repeat protein